MKGLITKFSLSILTGFLITFGSCKKENPSRPEMLQEGHTISLPVSGIHFKASGKKWSGTLHSFTQQIALKVDYTEEGFTLSQRNKLGTIEGPGHLVLKAGNTLFCYEVYLVNGSKPVRNALDYRSPKTVNPDSSLAHQRISFELDQWRNIIVRQTKEDLFEEQEVALPSTAGTYRAIKDLPLTSYYVQPGSTTSLELRSEFLEGKNAFKVSVGPLNDQYGNRVSDGTVITFIYNDRDATYRRETALLNGMASIEIPAEGSKAYSLFAKVGDISSSKIQLR